MLQVAKSLRLLGAHDGNRPGRVGEDEGDGDACSTDAFAHREFVKDLA